MTLNGTCTSARDWLCEPHPAEAQSDADWLGQGQLGSRGSSIKEAEAHKLPWLSQPRMDFIFETRALTGLELASELRHPLLLALQCWGSRQMALSFFWLLKI